MFRYYWNYGLCQYIFRPRAYAIRMTFIRLSVLCAAGVGLLLPASPPQGNASRNSEYPTVQVREEQAIVINGVTETWQLKWLASPKEVCEPSDTSLTCPCEGFAYGEGGDLDLVRLRNGAEIDRLHVTPLFEEEFGGTGRVAILQRWPADDDKDFSASQKPDFVATVSKRPTVQIMHFADYDHDRDATEFYLQTEAAPCGKSMGVVLGISKANPRLHAFGTVPAPNKPLYLHRHEWEALRDAQEPVEVLDWPCRDHGSDTQTTLLLRWSSDGISGSRREFTCTHDGKPGDLIHEEPL
jgi:hypothetical protein